MPKIEYRIGDGNTFLLWEDPWHSDGVLIQKLPQIAIGVPQQDKVGTFISQCEWCWPLPHSNEITEIVAGLPIIHGGFDMVRWRGTTGRITSTEVYTLFQQDTPKVIWATLLRGPFRIARSNFILWLALLGKLTTVDVSWLQSTNRNCVLCEDGLLETHEHLFFQCIFSRKCLQLLANEIRFTWPGHPWQEAIVRVSKQ
ncbi:UNVERIFIED_CONTAM: hypothetical protein Slati_4269200 [Sesamum latifolium]|uniref:Reverse transcriptase zinc-binding domain-containing protein n=1 Tax=Sesamum latifolium TaxID=2727402 RepID=A0AAW2TE07_9LAMI